MFPVHINSGSHVIQIAWKKIVHTSHNKAYVFFNTINEFIEVGRFCTLHHLDGCQTLLDSEFTTIPTKLYLELLIIKENVK